LPIDIKSGNAEGPAEFNRERKADVAEADDPDAGGPVPYFGEELIL